MIKNSIILTLKGQQYRLKPSFQAIMDIEERLGGIVGLALRVSEGDIGLKEATVFIWACMEERMPFEVVGAMILEEGLAQVSKTIEELLTICLAGTQGDL